jgi:hypothetical protein
MDTVRMHEAPTSAKARDRAGRHLVARVGHGKGRNGKGTHQRRKAGHVDDGCTGGEHGSVHAAPCTHTPTHPHTQCGPVLTQTMRMPTTAPSTSRAISARALVSPPLLLPPLGVTAAAAASMVAVTKRTHTSLDRTITFFGSLSDSLGDVARDESSARTPQSRTRIIGPWPPRVTRTSTCLCAATGRGRKAGTPLSRAHAHSPALSDARARALTGFSAGRTTCATWSAPSAPPSVTTLLWYAHPDSHRHDKSAHCVCVCLSVSVCL